ncbi:MAG: type IV pilus secretin PilQ [Mariprofundaceae bacterium]
MFKSQLDGMIMNSKGWLVKCLVVSVVFLSGLGMAPLAQATELTQLTLLDSDDGDVLRIEGSSELEYQVFDLDGPPRLILSFPNSSLAADIEGLNATGSGILSVRPTQDGTTSRVEVGLSQVLKYQLQEQGGALVIRFAATASKAKRGNSAVIKDIEVRDRGSVTELVLRGEHMDANHNAFMPQGKNQLVLDFWNGKSLLKNESFKYATQRINSITIGQAENRVRLVVGLLPASDMSQQIDASAHELIVRLGSVVAKKKPQNMMVESVVFKPDDRIAHVMIRTTATNPVINVQEKDDHIVIDFQKANLLVGQERSQDVSEFPGPVRQIDSYGLDGNVRVVARLREKVVVTSFQQGNVFTINFEPEDMALARLSHGERDEFSYTGQKVTFDFKDIDIRNALKLIAEMSDLNIIMSDDVAGTLTMRLVDVPWDQALELILSARGLGKQTSGNVMRVAPMDVLRAEYETKLDAQRGSQQLEPLRTEFITLSYTKVEDVKKILEGASANATKGGTSTTAATGEVSSSTSETSVGILSPRGSFLVDARTNTLILKDTEAAINSVKRLIATVDKPIKQVLIEGRIVEASDTFTRDMGVRWGGNIKNNTGVRFPSTVSVGAATGVAGTTGSQGFLVDLPAAGAAASGGGIGIALGSLNSLINLDLELSASEAEGEVKIVSNPRVITTNLKPATISQGQDVAFQTVSSNGTQTQFKKATLSLTATPQITADNHVIMQLQITKDAPVKNSLGTGILISTKSIDTEVYMDNGETVVIGGIYTRTTNDSTAGVPLLSSIPILGYLFKKKSKQDDRSELLIFVTPKILNTVGTRH